jgi:osmotically-inducible protein OsmY
VNATIAAHPEIDAGRIQVKVESGEIVLSGFVPDLQTRQAAAEAASQASGAAPIDNRLIVENNGTAEAQ